MQQFIPAEVMQKFRTRFYRLYGELGPDCLERLKMMVGRYGVGLDPEMRTGYWSQKDNVLITYGDMVCKNGEEPLSTLGRFLSEKLRGVVDTVHILPFFPYSSDDGFSVIDYRNVNADLGDWKDVEGIGKNFRLMFDLVLNHCSAKSDWFKQLVAGILPGRKYFIGVDPETDLSQVVRPRSSPVLTKVHTRNGELYLWATFSADQVDLDFSNPDVLFEFLDILFLYISQGVRIIRLDAIAYLWKRIGSSCIHLPETHEVVKLFRDVLNLVAPDVLLLTETNVPHEENISYFGRGDEAHIVYQFSLPPLLLHALHTGNAKYLTEWASSLGELKPGCTYLNFTASHDGVGVRPLEGLIPEEERRALIDAVLERGGHVSTKRNTDGTESPYEMNITYFDALCSPGNRVAKEDVDRFLCSQTVALSLKGIPALYFHSITGTRNDYVGVEKLGYPRAINRRKWNDDELRKQLDNPSTVTSRVFRRYSELLKIRAEHTAFHPDAEQIVHAISPEAFTLERTSPDWREKIIAIHSMRGEAITVNFGQIEAIKNGGNWTDIISGNQLANGVTEITLDPYQCVWLRMEYEDGCD